MKKENSTSSALLKHILLLVLLISFSVLILGGFWVYESAAPVPGLIVDENGNEITNHDNIMGGQAVYQKYNLMNYGSVLGHGAYLGEDWTADVLQFTVRYMREYYAQEQYRTSYENLSESEQAGIANQVINEIKTNRYDEKTDTLVLTDGQVYALNELREYYRVRFTDGDAERGLQANLISDDHMPKTDRAWVNEGDQFNQITDFFFWTAWLSGTERPELGHTYTNNWPYDPDAGNTVGWSALWWSAFSVALFVLMLGLILWIYFKYRFFMEDAYETFPTFDLNEIAVTPSQRKVGKYFAVVTLLFLAQGLLGGLLAHYYVAGTDFYGFDISSLLPFNVARGWHLQLAIFWIATAWLATGIYIAPNVGGREPKGQGLLVDILFYALVVLVGGSLIGQWLAVQGYLGNKWWLLGTQGWEYLELGRIWQIILVVGLLIWLFIVYRGIRDGLRKESDKGGLVHLLFYSAIAIPAFYGAAFFMTPGTNLTYADYWRWWVIHLWVEGMFEVFALVVIGYLLVSMGLVTMRSTVRAIYFQLIILLGSGVLGTGHHYYWIGAPEAWIGIGAVFSALEVIPLTLLILEAYEQYRMVQQGGHNFPYKASFWFLIAVGFWNFFGAGVLGFLINLPVVNYFMHGSYLTAAHAHGAMAGVYGFFAIALLLYSMRNIVKPEHWNDKLLNISFWGLNIGLMGMIVVTLFPVGVFQLAYAFEHGYWAARSLEFYSQPLISTLLGLRIIPDLIFGLVGVVPLVYFTIRAAFNLRDVTTEDIVSTEEKPSIQA